MKVLGGCEDSAEVEARIEELLLKSAGSQGRYFRPTFSTFRPGANPDAKPRQTPTNGVPSRSTENGGGLNHNRQQYRHQDRHSQHTVCLRNVWVWKRPKKPVCQNCIKLDFEGGGNNGGSGDTLILFQWVLWPIS